MKLSHRLERAVQPLQEFDTLIDHFLGPCKAGECVFAPRTDIVEQNDGFILSIELPGIPVENVSVEVAESQLTVSGEKTRPELDETSTVHRRERVTGKFERKFEFPTQVDFERIQAASRDGVLQINVPKAAQVLPRKVEIKINRS